MLNLVEYQDLVTLDEHFTKQLAAFKAELAAEIEKVRSEIPVVPPFPNLQRVPPLINWYMFPDDVGAPKLTSLTEQAVGKTFSVACGHIPQYEDSPIARPDRMSLQVTTLDKGTVTFYLYAYSAEYGANSNDLLATPTLVLVKEFQRVVTQDNHRYNAAVSLSQAEIDKLMGIPSRYGIHLLLRYKAEPGSEMSLVKTTLVSSYKPN